MTNGWTAREYGIARFLFATYLAVHFAQLLPWGAEVFSSEGVLPAPASPLLRLFPNVLAWCDAPAAVTAVLVTALLLTVPFALGIGGRAAAVALWYLWACLAGRNPLILNPSLPFVGWLLLLHAALPPARFGSASPRWHFPPPLFAAAWLVMALGYSYGGYTKLVSPSWIDGSALMRVLENPLARPTFLRDALLALPAPLLSAGTWAMLALELAFAPLALMRQLRPALWLAMLTLHLALLALIDFADLSLGMIVLHLVTFDPAWLHPLAQANALPVTPERRSKPVQHDPLEKRYPTG